MNHKPREIAENVLVLRTLVVNVYVVRTASSWVLVDAGLPGYAEAIRSAAAAFVGSTAPPTAIVLTHGHFDHVGSLEALLVEWPVPVFAHRLEVPYLTGQSAYPPPDPLAGRGALSLLSRLYPRGPIDISAQLRALPDNGRVPGMDDWRWVPTPGHSPGHVSFFRDRDRTLLAGDAVTTTRQESIVAVVTQRREVHGPPPVLHDRLARGSGRRRAPGSPSARPARFRPWRSPSRHGDARGTAGTGVPVRRARGAELRAVRPAACHHRRPRHREPAAGSVAARRGRRRSCRGPCLHVCLPTPPQDDLTRPADRRR